IKGLHPSLNLSPRLTRLKFPPQGDTMPFEEIKNMSGLRIKGSSQTHQMPPQGTSIGNRVLRRRTGCRLAAVSHKIRYREVDLMPDSAHHRNGTLCNRPGYHLLVECPEVLDAPTAAGNNHQI